LWRVQWVDKIIALLNSRVVILMFSLILPAFAAVSINYRLGVFGFFAHRDLTKESLREAVFVRLRQLRDSTGPSPKIAINREFPKAGQARGVHIAFDPICWPLSDGIRIDASLNARYKDCSDD
jgi:hypothetical protein